MTVGLEVVGLGVACIKQNKLRWGLSSLAQAQPTSEWKYSTVPQCLFLPALHIAKATAVQWHLRVSMQEGLGTSFHSPTPPYLFIPLYPIPLPDAPYLVSLDVSILVVQWGWLPGHIQLCGCGTVDGHVLRCCRGHWRARRLESECSWV